MNEKLREQAEEFAAWVAGFDWEAIRSVTDIVRGVLDKAKKVWASDTPLMPTLVPALPVPRQWSFFESEAPLMIGDRRRHARPARGVA